MINFVSTFPPIVCGIADYTKYLVSRMPLESWRVTSFILDGPSLLPETFGSSARVSYPLSLTDANLPFPLGGEIVWFQHTFGIWGKDPGYFLRFLEDAKKRDKKVIASFHTIHFESPETEWGISRKEKDLLAEALPLLDALTVFTRGAYQAVTRTFPHYHKRVVLIRHGVHLHPPIGQGEARERLLRYLINQPDIPSQKKRDPQEAYPYFFSPKTVILGSFGFLAAGKALPDLYRLRELAQEKLPQYRVLCLIIGSIRPGNGRKSGRKLDIVQELECFHDGEKNLFFEHYLPEELLPVAFRALDFSVFWCENATQSGRVSHAQGVDTCIIGRKLEGIGETLELSGVPTGETLEELADIIQRLTLDSELKEKARTSSRRYAHKYSYRAQARKHLLLAQSLLAGRNLPPLDTIS